MNCQEGKYIWPGIDNLAFTPPWQRKKNKPNLHLRIHLLNWKPFIWEVKDTPTTQLSKKKGVGAIFYYISLRMTKIAFSISRSEKHLPIYTSNACMKYIWHTQSLFQEALTPPPLIRQENQELPNLWRCGDRMWRGRQVGSHDKKSRPSRFALSLSLRRYSITSNGSSRLRVPNWITKHVNEGKKNWITTLYGIVHTRVESEKKAIKSGLRLCRSRLNQTGLWNLSKFFLWIMMSFKYGNEGSVCWNRIHKGSNTISSPNSTPYYYTDYNYRKRENGPTKKIKCEISRAYQTDMKKNYKKPVRSWIYRVFIGILK